MAVSLARFAMDELIVLDYEHSARSGYVTDIVEMFVNNDSKKLYEALRAVAREHGITELARAVILRFQIAAKNSGAFRTACDLAVSDFTNGRIRWDEVAESLLSE